MSSLSNFNTSQNKAMLTDWLKSYSEMSELIRPVDWSTSPLGSTPTWNCAFRNVHQLSEPNKSLDVFNQSMIGHEQRIIEIKEGVNTLCQDWVKSRNTRQSGGMDRK